MLIDTHAHIFYKDYADSLDDVLKRAADAGVAAIICPGLDLETSEQSLKLADRYDQVWAAVGVHPHDAESAPDNTLQELERLAAHDKVVAIGETGLDFYRNISPPEMQERLFRGQLELAAALGYPAIVHNRSADEGVLRILREVGYGNGVVHCFSSPPETARQVLDLGFHISFTGTVTFGKNHNEAVLRAVGLERVMVETDCPYLAPAPKRGRTNEPAYVSHVAAKIADILKMDVTEVARQTTENALALFSRMRLPNGSESP
ncbi:MAG: TatD family hydrolase [Candidatus Marinimicrobia bacterium]|nr:TatD family hydrolase [Candidatus Neomarinimicrobiota bacterium]